MGDAEDADVPSVRNGRVPSDPSQAVPEELLDDLGVDVQRPASSVALRTSACVLARFSCGPPTA